MGLTLLKSAPTRQGDRSRKSCYGYDGIYPWRHGHLDPSEPPAAREAEGPEGTHEGEDVRGTLPPTPRATMALPLGTVWRPSRHEAVRAPGLAAAFRSGSWGMGSVGAVRPPYEGTRHDGMRRRGGRHRRLSRCRRSRVPRPPYRGHLGPPSRSGLRSPLTTQRSPAGTAWPRTAAQGLRRTGRGAEGACVGAGEPGLGGHRRV